MLFMTSPTIPISLDIPIYEIKKIFRINKYHAFGKIKIPKYQRHTI
ncbi:hypothetical protein MNBD_ALPHA11-2261 [hydrothermal vent metagenome]|uniref:Uncharacterized protein n=1 Tax=hydrothermal vent metagenome TaxID=652676 RepID=A0A3B0U1A2_9ZZZZ